MNTPWYTFARSEIGVMEAAGDANNRRVLEYLACCKQLPHEMQEEDSTPWCSAFVNWCFAMCNPPIKGTGSAAARSWLDWGTVLSEPKQGCVVVFKRGNNGMQGHVTFFDHIASDGRWACVGGNQSDQVKVSLYDPHEVLGIRWPRDVQP